MFKGDSTFSRMEDDSFENTNLSLTNHPVVKLIEEEEKKSTRGRDASILEESKESSFHQKGDILEEFARE